MKRTSWLLIATVACGGPGSKNDTGGGDPPTYSADWEGVQGLLDDHCVSCHAAGGEAADLPFPDAIGLDLVTGEGTLIVAGDAAGSTLWRVLSDQLEPGDVGVMPKGSGPLAEATVAHVEQWITGGAEHPFADVDFDGDGATTNDGDCDETDPARHPAADEVCGDGVDNDCSGQADDGDAVDAIEVFDDDDDDGYGDPATSAMVCDAPAGTVEVAGDCDDGDPGLNPDTEWFPDGDGDGHGDPGGTPVTSCDPVVDHARPADDCNDADGAIHPGVDDILGNGVDEDCNGTADNATSHAYDIQPIWDTVCTNCHIGGILAQEGLDLSIDGHAATVDVPARQASGMDRVEPGDPATSYLWHKINDTHLSVGGSGGRMPPNAAPLSQPQLDLIEAWILEGALR